MWTDLFALKWGLSCVHQTGLVQKIGTLTISPNIPLKKIGTFTEILYTGESPFKATQCIWSKFDVQLNLEV